MTIIFRNYWQHRLEIKYEVWIYIRVDILFGVYLFVKETFVWSLEVVTWGEWEQLFPENVILDHSTSSMLKMLLGTFSPRGKDDVFLIKFSISSPILTSFSLSAPFEA